MSGEGLFLRYYILNGSNVSDLYNPASHPLPELCRLADICLKPAEYSHVTKMILSYNHNNANATWFAADPYLIILLLDQQGSF